MVDVYDELGAREAREQREVESWTEVRIIQCPHCDEDIVDGEQFLHRQSCDTYSQEMA